MTRLDTEKGTTRPGPRPFSPFRGYRRKSKGEGVVAAIDEQRGVAQSAKPPHWVDCRRWSRPAPNTTAAEAAGRGLSSSPRHHYLAARLTKSGPHLGNPSRYPPLLNRYDRWVNEHPNLRSTGQRMFDSTIVGSTDNRRHKVRGGARFVGAQPCAQYPPHRWRRGWQQVRWGSGTLPTTSPAAGGNILPPWPGP